MTGDSLAAALTAAGVNEEGVVAVFAYAALNKHVVTLQQTIQQKMLDKAAADAAVQSEINDLQTQLDAANAALRAGVVASAGAGA